MSGTKDFVIEDQNKSKDPFNADEALTQPGRGLREKTTIEDCELCQQSKDTKEINDVLADTMAFITNSLPKQE